MNIGAGREKTDDRGRKEPSKGGKDEFFANSDKPGPAPNKKSSSASGTREKEERPRERDERPARERDERPTSAPPKRATESSSSSGSGWKASNTSGAVTLTLQVSSGEFVKTIAVRGDKIKVKCFESTVGDGTSVSVYTVKLSDVLRGVPSEFSSSMCHLKVPQAKPQALGTVKELSNGDKTIQVSPSAAYDDSFEAVLFLSSSGSGHSRPASGKEHVKASKPAYSDDDNSDFEKHEPVIKSSPKKGVPGPMAKVFVEDEKSKKSSSASGSKRENLEVVGNAYGKGGKGAPRSDDDYDDVDRPLSKNSKGGESSSTHSTPSKGRKNDFQKDYSDDDDERENNGFAVAARESMDDLGGGSVDGSDVDDDDFEPEEGTRSLGGAKKGAAKTFRNAQRFSANRPWAGAIVSPSNVPPAKADLPGEELVLEYVHGYRMRDVNNNAYYLAPGLIVFPAGAVGVVMDIEKNTQRFFQGRHKEDITAITVHPSKRLVATGDIVSVADGCYIYIWDPKTPEDTHRQVQIRVGEKKLAKGISDLQFSPDGKYLCATAMDDEHTVYVYDWQKAGKLIAKDKGHTDDIFGITFNPKNSTEFVTFGVKHLKRWAFDPQAGKIKGERGLFGNRKVQSIICCAFLPNGSYVTGTHGGELMFWNGNQVMNVMEGLHTGPIFSVYFDADMGLFTAGTDGYLILHDPKTFDTIDKIQLEAGVRAIDVSPEGKVLVGLEDSVLLEIEGIARGGEKDVTRVLEAHCSTKMEEVWGCSVNPVIADEYVTCGDDSMVFKRSINKAQVLASTRLQGRLRAVTWSWDGKFIAVGNDFGDIYILRSSDLSQAHFRKYEKSKGIKSKINAVEVMKFSPDGKMLAAGTRDSVVYIFEMGSKFRLMNICKGHSSFISHLDWSADSQFIQTNSGDYELLFWSALTGKQITKASSVKDVEWATFTCILGWPVQGIFEKGMQGNDINYVDRHPGKQCLASGDDFFNVRLHSYPCAKEGMPCKKYLGHGSHVTKVVFTADGKYLLSTGGMDGCTFQWRVVGGGSGKRNEGDGGKGSRPADTSDDDYSD
ncbi:Echinoderm microtubule-associated protein-like 5 [Chytridiales sp. JEL 0842]|nr:Echinoderm microtubule-associated protein-like 5 [Chytridiales sp. JEL 0842]